jgi:ABC-type transporter Mla MlaB component
VQRIFAVDTRILATVRVDSRRPALLVGVFLVTVKLPSLLLDANPRAILQVQSHVREVTATTVELDGSEVMAIEPVGACLLANAAHTAHRAGKALAINRWSPRLRTLLQDMGSKAEWLERQSYSDAAPSSIPVAPTLAMSVSSHREANKVANELSDRISQFIPEEDRQEMLQDHHGLRIYHSICVFRPK